MKLSVKKSFPEIGTGTIPTNVFWFFAVIPTYIM